jgi:UDP-galactopyranose mutase
MDIICFSHLRWNFVYQRPQHLLKRFAKHARVFFIEEPVFDADIAYLDNSLSPEGVWIIVPHLQSGESDPCTRQILLLQNLFSYFNVTDYLCWYYTPMALTISAKLSPRLIVYDCMDELSAFKNPPPGIIAKETELLQKADLVFTGGHSLYNAKKKAHPRIYPFPSSIDKKHFAKARRKLLDPVDQENIPYPRIGFFGVIDERMDIALLDEMARLQPDWHFVLVGPIVKIDPGALPAHSNIHYLGSKDYKKLPEYLAGWEVAMMPFALNESTRFISPTKTPEYLAGGVPVVSTAIQDVVNPYGDKGLVYIAHSAEDFIEGIAQQLEKKHDTSWLQEVDSFLEDNSWDTTVDKMMFHINVLLEAKQQDKLIKKEEVYV